jgi:hypothetical protein
MYTLLKGSKYVIHSLAQVHGSLSNVHTPTSKRVYITIQVIMKTIPIRNVKRVESSTYILKIQIKYQFIEHKQIHTMELSLVSISELEI